GTCVYLIMPTSNTASFQAFLDVLARKFARQDILLVLDGAPNHRCGHLIVPDNITLLYLPPYSPELNPKENLWDEIRENIFKNYALKSMDAVCASSSRPSSISSETPSSLAPSPASPISSTHSDVEMVSEYSGNHQHDRNRRRQEYVPFGRAGQARCDCSAAKSKRFTPSNAASGQRAYLRPHSRIARTIGPRSRPFAVRTYSARGRLIE